MSWAESLGTSPTTIHNLWYRDHYDENNITHNLEKFIHQKKELYNKVKDIKYKEYYLPEIASMTGCSLDTIYKRYQQDINMGSNSLEQLMIEHSITGSKLTSSNDIITIFLGTENEQSRKLRDWIQELNLNTTTVSRYYRNDILNHTNKLIAYIEKHYLLKQQGKSYGQRDNSPLFKFYGKEQTLRQWAAELKCDYKHLLRIYNHDNQQYTSTIKFLTKIKQQNETGTRRKIQTNFFANMLLNINGVEKSIAQWAKEIPDINYQRLHSILREKGEDGLRNYIIDAINNKLQHRHRRLKPLSDILLTVNGEEKTLKQWGKLPNVNYAVLWNAYNRGGEETACKYLLNVLNTADGILRGRYLNTLLIVDGEEKTLKQWATKLECDYKYLSHLYSSKGEEATRKYILKEKKKNRNN